jgi:uncharacterized protein
MPEYLSPGVYVEEIPSGPHPIEGVATSTAAFLGETERGAVEPRLVTSFGEFERWFGGTLDAPRFLPNALDGFFLNGGARALVCRVAGTRATPAEAPFGGFVLRAVGAGTWGNRIWARIDGSTSEPGEVPAPAGFRVRIAYWSGQPSGFHPFDPFVDAVRLPRPAVVEDFDDLSLDEDSGSTRFMSGSTLCLLVRDATLAAGILPANGSQALAGGTDDPEPLAAAAFKGEGYSGAASAGRQGLAALAENEYDDVALLCAPGAAVDVQQALVAHCEQMRYRFAVIDCGPGASDPASIDPRAMIRASAFAAFYYPWLSVSDPNTGVPKWIPPCGHVLGAYARTDAERGVFKAPANEALAGVRQVEFNLDENTLAALNQRRVNAIRAFPGQGIRLWGARTLAQDSDTEWKYVSVRRLLIFIEHSIEKGTQWAVFEPNDARLWTRVKDTIRGFLRAQWRLGAFAGQKEEQAFFVKCDEQTMTQDDIDNGRLVCEIGIAPVRPAEFVIVRIFRQTAKLPCP